MAKFRFYIIDEYNEITGTDDERVAKEAAPMDLVIDTESATWVNFDGMGTDCIISEQTVYQFPPA